MARIKEDKDPVVCGEIVTAESYEDGDDEIVFVGGVSLSNKNLLLLVENTVTMCCSLVGKLTGKSIPVKDYIPCVQNAEPKGMNLFYVADGRCVGPSFEYKGSYLFVKTDVQVLAFPLVTKESPKCKRETYERFGGSVAADHAYSGTPRSEAVSTKPGTGDVTSPLRDTGDLVECNAGDSEKDEMSICDAEGEQNADDSADSADENADSGDENADADKNTGSSHENADADDENADAPDENADAPDENADADVNAGSLCENVDAERTIDADENSDSADENVGTDDQEYGSEADKENTDDDEVSDSADHPLTVPPVRLHLLKGSDQFGGNGLQSSPGLAPAAWAVQPEDLYSESEMLSDEEDIENFFEDSETYSSPRPMSSGSDSNLSDGPGIFQDDEDGDPDYVPEFGGGLAEKKRKMPKLKSPKKPSLKKSRREPNTDTETIPDTSDEELTKDPNGTYLADSGVLEDDDDPDYEVESKKRKKSGKSSSKPKTKKSSSKSKKSKSKKAKVKHDVSESGPTQECSGGELEPSLEVEENDHTKLDKTSESEEHSGTKLETVKSSKSKKETTAKQNIKESGLTPECSGEELVPPHEETSHAKLNTSEPGEHSDTKLETESEKSTTELAQPSSEQTMDAEEDVESEFKVFTKKTKTSLVSLISGDKVISKHIEIFDEKAEPETAGQKEPLENDNDDVEETVSQDGVDSSGEFQVYYGPKADKEADSAIETSDVSDVASKLVIDFQGSPRKMGNKASDLQSSSEKVGKGKHSKKSKSPAKMADAKQPDSVVSKLQAKLMKKMAAPEFPAQDDVKKESSEVKKADVPQFIMVKTENGPVVMHMVNKEVAENLKSTGTEVWQVCGSTQKESELKTQNLKSGVPTQIKNQMEITENSLKKTKSAPTCPTGSKGNEKSQSVGTPVQSSSAGTLVSNVASNTGNSKVSPAMQTLVTSQPGLTMIPLALGGASLIDTQAPNVKTVQKTSSSASDGKVSNPFVIPPAGPSGATKIVQPIQTAVLGPGNLLSLQKPGSTSITGHPVVPKPQTAVNVNPGNVMAMIPSSIPLGAATGGQGAPLCFTVPGMPGPNQSLMLMVPAVPSGVTLAGGQKLIPSVPGTVSVSVPLAMPVYQNPVTSVQRPGASVTSISSLTSDSHQKPDTSQSQSINRTISSFANLPVSHKPATVSQKATPSVPDVATLPASGKQQIFMTRQPQSTVSGIQNSDSVRGLSVEGGPHTAPNAACTSTKVSSSITTAGFKDTSGESVVANQKSSASAVQKKGASNVTDGTESGKKKGARKKGASKVPGGRVSGKKKGASKKGASKVPGGRVSGKKKAASKKGASNLPGKTVSGKKSEPKLPVLVSTKQGKFLLIPRSEFAQHARQLGISDMSEMKPISQSQSDDLGRKRQSSSETESSPSKIGKYADVLQGKQLRVEVRKCDEQLSDVQKSDQSGSKPKAARSGSRKAKRSRLCQALEPKLRHGKLPRLTQKAADKLKKSGAAQKTFTLRRPPAVDKTVKKTQERSSQSAWIEVYNADTSESTVVSYADSREKPGPVKSATEVQHESEDLQATDLQEKRPVFIEEYDENERPVFLEAREVKPEVERMAFVEFQQQKKKEEGRRSRRAVKTPGWLEGFRVDEKTVRKGFEPIPMNELVGNASETETRNVEDEEEELSVSSCGKRSGGKRKSREGLGVISDSYSLSDGQEHDEGGMEYTSADEHDKTADFDNSVPPTSVKLEVEDLKQIVDAQKSLEQDEVREGTPVKTKAEDVPDSQNLSTLTENVSVMDYCVNKFNVKKTELYLKRRAFCLSYVNIAADKSHKQLVGIKCTLLSSELGLRTGSEIVIAIVSPDRQNGRAVVELFGRDNASRFTNSLDQYTFGTVSNPHAHTMVTTPADFDKFYYGGLFSLSFDYNLMKLIREQYVPSLEFAFDKMLLNSLMKKDSGSPQQNMSIICSKLMKPIQPQQLETGTSPKARSKTRNVRKSPLVARSDPSDRRTLKVSEQPPGDQTESEHYAFSGTKMTRIPPLALAVNSRSQSSLPASSGTHSTSSYSGPLQLSPCVTTAPKHAALKVPIQSYASYKAGVSSKTEKTAAAGGPNSSVSGVSHSSCSSQSTVRPQPGTSGRPHPKASALGTAHPLENNEGASEVDSSRATVSNTLAEKVTGGSVLGRKTKQTARKSTSKVSKYHSQQKKSKSPESVASHAGKQQSEQIACTVVSAQPAIDNSSESSRIPPQNTASAIVYEMPEETKLSIAVPVNARDVWKANHAKLGFTIVASINNVETSFVGMHFFLKEDMLGLSKGSRMNIFIVRDPSLLTGADSASSEELQRLFGPYLSKRYMHEIKLSDIPTDMFNKVGRCVLCSPVDFDIISQQGVLGIPESKILAPYQPQTK